MRHLGSEANTMKGGNQRWEKFKITLAKGNNLPINGPVFTATNVSIQGGSFNTAFESAEVLDAQCMSRLRLVG